jgi:hypothetical protein
MSPNIALSEPVRVSIPVSVASEIGSLKKAIGTVLDRLGCPACCSGHDVFLELQRDVAFATELRADPDVVLPATGKFRADPMRRIGLQPEFASNLDNVFAAIDKLAELSGHPACATGCDMFLQLQRQFVINPALDIRETVATFG